MPYINQHTREIRCKIVYYGPGLGGKTTNLEYIHRRSAEEARGNLVSLTTAQDRTLYFDFMPLSLGKIRGYDAKFQLYTVPGQVVYEQSRKLILGNVDGVVFVADSQTARMDANLESLDSLRVNLAEQGKSLHTVPCVMQWNKRDLPRIATVEELSGLLNPHDLPEFEAVASEGTGVFDSLKAVAKRVLTKLKRGE